MKELAPRAALYALANAAMAAWFLSRGDHAWDTFALDDAYIHHVYAEGIAYGEGLAYNPGEPAAGTTSPLWALVLTPFHVIGLAGSTLVGASKVLGCFTMVVAALLADRLASSWSGGAGTGPGPGIAAGLLVAIDPAMMFSALSGMEVPLAAALLLAALRSLERLHFPTAGLLLGLTTLTRPELAVVVVLVIGWQARRGIGRRGLLWLALPSLVLLCAWSLWCLHATDRLLPTTYFAKHVTGLSLLDQFGDVLDAGLAVLGGRWLAPLVLAAGFAVHAFGPRALAPLWLVLGFVAAVAWAHDLRETERFFWMRYALPVRPLLLVVVGMGLWSVPHRVGRAIVCALALLVAAGASVPAAAEYGQSCTNIAALNVAAAHWLDEHAPRGAWLASADAGAVRLLTERPVVDLVGLNDHRVLEDRAAVLRARDPAYYVVFESWFPAMVASPRFEVVHRLESTPYVLCRECEQSEMLILRRR